jgi:hypothetical protein
LNWSSAATSNSSHHACRRILPDWDNRDGLTVTALLQYRYGRWNLVGHAIGATDAWYDGQAPRPLMRSRCY